LAFVAVTMEIRSEPEIKLPYRRLTAVFLWLWVVGITAAYLHQFSYVFPLILSLLD
tara:strand:+ start:150 stop:317 length:168 start_codon:yes stop_codon:yes gene_type:complete